MNMLIDIHNCFFTKKKKKFITVLQLINGCRNQLVRTSPIYLFFFQYEVNSKCVCILFQWFSSYPQPPIFFSSILYYYNFLVIPKCLLFYKTYKFYQNRILFELNLNYIHKFSFLKRYNVLY